MLRLDQWSGAGGRRSVALERRLVRSTFSLSREQGEGFGLGTNTAKNSGWFVLLSVAVLVLGSCATTGLWVDASDAAKAAEANAFPARAELEELAARTPPAKELNVAVEVPRWELTGPLPDKLELLPHTYEDPWGKELVRMVEAEHPDVFVSTDMACTAREVGRFSITRGKLPSGRVRTFIKSSCGAPFRINIRRITRQIESDSTEEELLERWSGWYRETLTQQLQDRTLAGVWVGRELDELTFVIVTSAPTFRIDPMPLTPGPDGGVVVRGELFEEGTRVSGAVNRGDFSWGDCESNRKVEFPFFELRCEIDPSDVTTWLEVSVFQPGRLLGNIDAEMLIYSDNANRHVYEAPQLIQISSLTIDDPVEEFLYRLNEVRQRAQLPPVALAVKQSQLAQELTPIYFSSDVSESQESREDRIALGLMAGWDVEGMIKNASFRATSVSGDEPVNVLLAAMLETPFGRSNLLGPGVTKVAIGLQGEPRQGERSALAALFASYHLFGEPDYDAELDGVLDRIAAIRKEKEQPVSVWYEDLEPAAIEAAQMIESGDATPREAMDWLMGRVVKVVRRGVRGYLITTDDLETINFPQELLEGPSYGMTAAIARYQPEGSPWGRYAVIFVSTARGGAAATASR